MIVQPENLSFNEAPFAMVIYGVPGIGKSTLALSAPDPVFIDFDNGVRRVKPYHRKTTIVCNSYEEVRDDLKSDLVKAAKTIIIDTGGSFVTYLQDWALRTDPAANKKKGGGLSITGFGAVKAETASFTSYILKILKKNLIYVFHSNEEKNKDGTPYQRILCEGALRTTVWQCCDFGAFMHVEGDKTILSFRQTEEYFAKGCHGIEGDYVVPRLKETDNNDFLTRLFEKASASMAEEDAFMEKRRMEYERIMAIVQTIVDGIVDADSATEAAKQIPTLNHALTSLYESRALLTARTNELRLTWDKSLGQYVGPVNE